MGTCLRCSNTMLLLFILFVSSSLLVPVESYVAHIQCHQNERETKTTKEDWHCDQEEVKCSRTITTCGSDGSGDEVAGWHLYQSDGLESAVGGGGWDCRHKCRSCKHICSGSRSKTKWIKGLSSSSYGSRPFSSWPSNSRPSEGSRNCNYTCKRGGPCKATFGGHPRAGRPICLQRG